MHSPKYTYATVRVCASIFFLLPFTVAATSATVEKPNIVLIFIDDMGYGDCLSPVRVDEGSTRKIDLRDDVLLASTLQVKSETLPKAKRFDINGHTAIVYAATKPAIGKPWIWYAPSLKGGLSIYQREYYRDAFFKAGISIAGYDLGEVRGAPTSTAKFHEFYEEMVRRGYSAKPILLGQSRGGLMLLSWAVDHPGKVGAFVGIYPVLNLASWPLQRSEVTTLADYNLTEEELVARLAEFNPINKLSGLLRHATVASGALGRSRLAAMLARTDRSPAASFRALMG